MADQYSRTRLLLGADGLEALRNARVILFGLGGVGGHTAEALARSGIGHLDLVDDDDINLTNLNRQILALHSTIGISKVEAAKKRILDIDPTIEVRIHQTFFLPETADQFDFSQYDYVVDAIDTVTGKLTLMELAKKAGVPIISCMGTGNKLDPTAFKITDIYKTDTCPLCRVMRRELKARNIKKLKVLYSTETPHNDGERTPASISFVPSVAGLIIAGEVIKDLMK